jgi:hypothetical protein
MTKRCMWVRMIGQVACMWDWMTKRDVCESRWLREVYA